jgi:hypothetical protein
LAAGIQRISIESIVIIENSMQRRQFIHLAISASTIAMTLNACKHQPNPAKVKPQKILFLGNSFTQANNMPTLLEEFATTAHQQTTTTKVAPGGWTLQQHANNPESISAIASQPWNYVVLQEQSTLPAEAKMPQAMMFPAIRSLASRIQTMGSKPLLFLTWGRSQGMPEQGYQDYATMQQAITTSYLSIAAELNLAIAPVGIAWQTIFNEHPEIDLWAKDGVHPSLSGSFIAACVFYAILYRQHPQEIKYNGLIEPQKAAALQKVAGNTVLNNRAAWRLN